MYEANANQKSRKPEKEKRRNNEKRKEKSRDAARCRRSRESDIFNDLATLLPLQKKEVEHLDKASIMRLSIAYLKVQNMLKNSNLSCNIDSEKDVKMISKFTGTQTLNTLDGFLLILSEDGIITYISENIHEFLGLSHIDLLGQPIWEYTHQCDHEELRDSLHGRHISHLEVLNRTNCEDFQPEIKRDFFLRLKCTLTSRGRSVNIKSASYKVIHITGHIVCDAKNRHLLAIARPLPHPINIEAPLGFTTFLTKHSLDMKFKYVDDKMLNLLGYMPEHLLSTSLFILHHAEDSENMLLIFKSLINKGQIETRRYRYLARYGGYVWVVTQATVLYEKQKPSSVVCINYAISGIENESSILSHAQLEANKNIEINQHKKNNIPGLLVEKNCQITLKGKRSEPLHSLRRSVTATIFSTTEAKENLKKKNTPRPHNSTLKIFTKRTEDMNKGFLMLGEDKSEITMLKDHSDDLTHLAPTAGDSCIPLETVATFPDIFNDFIIHDMYDALLPDDMALVSQESIQKQPQNLNIFNSNCMDEKIQQNSCKLKDPFINHRDELRNNLPLSLLRSELSKSPEGSMPSLGSPENDLAFITLTMEDDLDLRAPYIPMNETEDLPLLMSDDLMWGGTQPEKESKRSNQSSEELVSIQNKKKKVLDKSTEKCLHPVESLKQKFEVDACNWKVEEPLLNLSTNTLKRSQDIAHRISKNVSTKRPNLTVIMAENKKKRPKHEESKKDFVKTPAFIKQLIESTKTLSNAKRQPDNSQEYLLCTKPSTQTSVLMNLLISGCDLNSGYTCFPDVTKSAKL
ncbi:hypoxia-inducible factor 1-alpha-like isoform X4 [Culicoides brevitarsis]|uniref:hypoxia-inducible factor 1-alpha-like isoform X4 n=1 Tax=Culicoides brevitarsis TaxID=469753 RepID=UPI00307C69BC